MLSILRSKGAFFNGFHNTINFIKDWVEIAYIPSINGLNMFILVDNPIEVKIETGIPQGSPISPILFMLYLRNICRLETEGAYSLSYADGFAITVTSNSAKNNCKKLEGIALELMSRAKEAAISFDISKTELIHFHSKRTTIEEGLKLGDVEISPKPLVRWLGVFLDSKLTFKQHVETQISKAKAAFYLIRRLGNT